MKLRLVCLALALLLCCSCGMQTVSVEPIACPPAEAVTQDPSPVQPAPADPPEETDESAAIPFPPGVPCSEPESDEQLVSVSLYTAEEGEIFGSARQWSYRFDGMSPVEYDQFAPPARFDGDKSLWMTYNRDGSFDNCVIGRCIQTQAEWDVFAKALFSAEYAPAPGETIPFGTPEFLLREGTECAQSTGRNPPGGKGYIDDELCRYCVSPDGSVLRVEPDGTISRAVAPLDEETVARLYLLYETYFRSYAVLFLSLYYLNEPGQGLRLLVRHGEEELSVPEEKWDAFCALLSVDEDKEVSSDIPCFAVVNQLFVQEDYPSPEVLRFRFLTADDDPDAAPFRWLSLREDGRLITEMSGGGGMVHYVARWTVTGRSRYVSQAVFDVDAVLALLEE